MKKILIRLVNIISVAVIVLAVFVLLNVVLTKSGSVPNIFGYSVFRVLTGSMEPELPVDSLIVVKRFDAKDIEVGDVVSFFSQDPAYEGAVNTHRVVAIEKEGNSVRYITKGDANPIEDKYYSSSEDIIGKVVFVSHPLGVAVRLLSNPLIFIPIIIIPLFLILITNIVKTVKYTKKVMREEEEEEIRRAIEKIREEMK